MSLLSNGAALREEVSLLTHVWQRAGDSWRDQQHARMGSLYIEPLNQAYVAADSAVQTMSTVLQQVRKECGWEA
ncbi:MAG: hypothetical protein QF733_06500 [Phycisphaerales bacterium]|jgi:hypothetical protein|nr:hypothetical protein [Phycisphaerales bacterium]